MDSDQGKLFVGGISWDTTEETLKEFFKAYGEVVEAVIMRDRATGRARGFGFVVFADPSVLDRVLQEKHSIDGRMVEVKRAMPRDEQQNAQRGGNTGGPRTKKIFVGGLASTVAEDDFRMYFEQFGNITDVVVMYDHATQRHRGFGFITFDSEDAVDRVLQKGFHELKDKMVEVKRAIPKELFQGTGRSSYGQGQRSSPIGGFGARPNARYGVPPSAGRGGGYPSYGAVPGYGAAGYANTGGYGSGVNGGYAVAPGYGPPAATYAGGTYGGGYATAPANNPYGGGAAGYGGGYGSAPLATKNNWGGNAAASAGYPPGGAGYWGPGAQTGQAPVSGPNYGYGAIGYEAAASGGYGASGGQADTYGNSGYTGTYNPTPGNSA
eukprot:Gb_33012 [translate_table: standard]